MRTSTVQLPAMSNGLRGLHLAESKPWSSAPNAALAAWQGVGLKDQPHP